MKFHKAAMMESTQAKTLTFDNIYLVTKAAQGFIMTLAAILLSA